MLRASLVMVRGVCYWLCGLLVRYDEIAFLVFRLFTYLHRQSDENTSPETLYWFVFMYKVVLDLWGW